MSGEQTTSPNPREPLSGEIEVLNVRTPPADRRSGGKWRCGGCDDPQVEAPALFLLVRRRHTHRMAQWIRLCDGCARGEAIQRIATSKLPADSGEPWLQALQDDPETRRFLRQLTARNEGRVPDGDDIGRGR